ncbi:MAG: biotin carboxyl carrier protein [Ignavibacteria bacterium]|nr:biotin carboxyl carrier protein [Ignavibacteria bacterium]
MDLNYLRRLVKIFDESTVTELSIEEEGSKVKLSKRPTSEKVTSSPVISYQQTHEMAVQPAAPVTSQSKPVQEISTTEEQQPVTFYEIKSPMVGTFYRSSTPEAEPFVGVGGHIKAGSTLCIIEAMKLMNEIESDISGIIVAILVNNADPVEFNQVLFHIQPD